MERNEAWALLTKYNKDHFHLQHALTVEAVMRWYANELGYGDEADFWATVGLLHDLDFEQWPEQHCQKCQELMREAGVDERTIHAVAPATVTASAATSRRSMRWRRYSSRRTS